MKKIQNWIVRTPFVASVVVFGAGVFLNIANAQNNASVVNNQATFGKLLCNIVTSMWWIVIVVSIIMVLVAAFEYVTAGDDTEKTTKARKTLTWAAVGIAVALMALGFPALIADVIGNGATVTNSYFGSCGT
jgi:threonine/homoserine/homoserine lactone efflux protein